MLIGEVADRSGVSKRMLRHYDALGLVQPTGRTSGGYREYSGEDIRRLLHVESLRSLGLSLREVQRALDEPGFAPADLIDDLIGHTRARMAAEAELLERLERVAATGPADWESVLGVIALLRGMGSDHAAWRQQAALQADSALPAEALAAAILSESEPSVAGALRWALARLGDDGLATLTTGLASTEAAIRRRATLAIAAIDGARSTAALRPMLADPDDEVREHAAVTLGVRGELDAVPTLIAMIVAGHRDVEAAEILGGLAVEATTGADIVEGLTAAFAGPSTAADRLRLAQALAEIPGAGAHRVLTAMIDDPDHTVSRTAAVIAEAHH